MTNNKAREILKKHCAAYGDSRYEPAMWVIEALQDAVAQEREACIAACMRATPDHEMVKTIGDAAHYAACANAIKARSNI